MGAAWLVLVELVHRQRKTPFGQKLAAFDRGLRYLLLAGLLSVALGMVGDLPYWLRLKLAAFAGIIACGVAIRFCLIGHFRAWATMAKDGPTAEGNAMIQQIYVRATATSALLWLCIAAAAALAVFKP
jgi:hypothetical protein